jgi:hypothetical protein
MNTPVRETAVNLASRGREMRAPNPFNRIAFAGADSNRFSILRFVSEQGRRKSVHFGSYDTLQDAIEARDSFPEWMRLGEKFRLKENQE